MELHVLPVLGGYRLSELTAPMLNAFYDKLLTVGGVRGPLSPRTVRYVHLTLHKALSDAVDADVVSANVASRAKAPRPGNRMLTEAQVWDVSELRRFLAFVRGTYLGAVWRLLALTGMRRGELLGLRWADVDVTERRVSVRCARVSVGGAVVESSPKGGRGRVIDIDDETASALVGYRAHQRAALSMKRRDGEAADLVATLETGAPVHPDVFSRMFTRLVDEAGLRPIRLHDVRHTHCTLALQAGVPVKVVSERLGHRDVAFTLASYAHVIPGMQAEAASRLASLVDNTAPSPPASGR
jgi:integrase